MSHNKQHPFRIIANVAAVTVFALLITACEPLEEDPAIISGTVLHAQTEEPISGALVQLMDVDATRIIDETTTGEDGRFSLSVTIDTPTAFRLRATSTGYNPADRTISVEPEQNVSLAAPVLLSPRAEDDDGGTEPREARSITLEGRSAEEIGVRGSGSLETATLRFVVLDGDGAPLDAASRALVRFSLVNQPSTPGSPDAEFLYPEEVRTDAEGVARVTLTSGTRSGPVQVRAEVETPEGVVASTPVVIVIHGGLPDQTYFTVAPVRLNFHGRVRFGIENVIQVIAGDQYGNPVQPDTEVYFTTTHGVITGGGATDAMGRASATLQAAEPLPHSDGLATITARTAGVGGATVTRSTTVLFSGPTRIELEFLGGSLDGTGERYAYRVTDDLGNPIEGGSTVSVTVDGNQIQTLGDTGITIPDSREPGDGITEFSFLVRAIPEADDPSIDSILIQVSSPNGNRRYLFYSVASEKPGMVAPADIIEF